MLKEHRIRITAETSISQRSYRIHEAKQVAVKNVGAMTYSTI